MREIYTNSSFTLLHQLHHSRDPELTPDNFAKALIIKASDQCSPEAFQNTINFFDIKLEWDNALVLRAQYEKKTTEVINLDGIICNAFLAWQSDPQKGTNILNCFVKQGLNLNNQSQNLNALFIAISYNMPSGFIKTLIDFGADPNLSIPSISASSSLFNTALCSAMINGNIETVQLFLNYIDAEHTLHLGYGFLHMIDYMPQNQATCDIKYIATKALLTIENALLEQILDTRDAESKNIEYNLTETLIALPKQEKSHKQKKRHKKKSTKQKEDSDKKHQDDVKLSGDNLDNQTEYGSSKKNEIKEEEDSTIEIAKTSDTDFIDDTKISDSNITNLTAENTTYDDAKIASYLGLKTAFTKCNSISQHQRLTHMFDQYILENRIDELHILLGEHPELYSYSITALLEHNVPNAVASDVLAYSPNLTEQFFTLKKSMVNSSKQNINTDIVALGQNVHKATPLFDGQIFFTFTDEIYNKLPKSKASRFEKVEIIASNSTGKNGIKFYKNAIKFKLNNSDEAPYATKQYIYQKDIFILFDKLENHSWYNRQTKPLAIKYVTQENEWHSMLQGNYTQESTSGDYYEGINIAYEDVELVGGNNATELDL